MDNPKIEIEPETVQGYRAQCSNCMAVTQDPDTRQCPACGSRRLVVLAHPETTEQHRSAGKSGGQKSQARAKRNRERSR